MAMRNQNQDAMEVDESLVQMMPCSVLREILNGEHMCDVIVIDVRPYSDYVVGHIPNAFSVRLSSLLLRRLVQAKISLVDIVVDEQKDRFRTCVARLTEKRIVAYDDTSCDPDTIRNDPKNPLFTVIKSLQRDFPGVSATILEGGYTAFNGLCPDLREAIVVRASSVEFNDPDLTGERSPCERPVRDAYPSAILPDFLFVGSQGHAQSKTICEQLRITHILNITATCPNWHPHIQYKNISIKDTWNQNITSYFQEAFDFIEDARRSGGRVLVHCVAGISRSPTVTIAYLMRFHGLSLRDAMALVKSKRNIISPNLDFLVELEQYERLLNPSLGPAPPMVSPDPTEYMSVITEEAASAAAAVPAVPVHTATAPGAFTSSSRVSAVPGSTLTTPCLSPFQVVPRSLPRTASAPFLSAAPTHVSEPPSPFRLSSFQLSVTARGSTSPRVSPRLARRAEQASPHPLSPTSPAQGIFVL